MTAATFLKTLIEAWTAWSELFEGFPVSSNFGAFLGLMMILAIAAIVAVYIWDYMSIE